MTDYTDAFIRQDLMNTRVQSRHFSDYALEPNFSARPVSTKYSMFGIVAQNAPKLSANGTRESITPLKPHMEHNVETNFNPATRNGPFKTYARNIDTETVLRNQTMALQKGSQAVYVPSSTSDLYNVTVVSRPSEQPYSLLFERPTFSHSVHPNLTGTGAAIGRDRFYNNTRVQLRQPM
jgi:hypothetical protein